ncbi:AAA family ATPase [Delftia tsuruhatensis]|uniref:AAA family ATPase n=2 Tax=Comamonadaceae TaxID=80864 RepID=UPI0008E3CF0F|nr:AAA family ATPase [Delftia tsuruhatensis]SFB51121.1 AAA domain-containing protein, putative AbiEii toxin, Type IV TA system [Delftia tsuruhatensis]
MKIRSLIATKVHGYLPIRINFHEDCTFLIGLNGAGKTSALRLLTAMMTPSLEELASIDFEYAEVKVTHGEKTLNIIAKKHSGEMTLSLSDVADELKLTAAHLQFLVDSKYREVGLSPIKELIQANLVYKILRSLPTPIFLGIERRTAWSANAEELDDRQNRSAINRWISVDYPGSHLNVGLGGFGEVNQLVRSKVAEIRAAQVKLDDALRIKFFTKAFEYKPTKMFDGKVQLPSREDLSKYRSQLGTIERVAENLKLPAPEMTATLTQFFDQMSRVVSTMETQMNARRPVIKTRGPLGRKKWENPPVRTSEPIPDKDFVEWLVNSPQADRVIDSLELFNSHEQERIKLNAPINGFLDLLNGFFSQTNKIVEISDTGNLVIYQKLKNSPRTLSALASGERQLLNIIGHLILNPDLINSGVFMVDEPELSLHIAWQERFVDAITAANPKIQFIMATHSPAIVLDRDEKCIESLNNFDL